MDFKDFCDRLLEKTDIVNLISRYCTLKKSGKHYFACCPFHGERTPSLSIDPDAKLFYCFGCHKGGNAITFLKDIENIDSIDAIKLLAQEAHMELPEMPGRGGKKTDKDKQARLLALLKDAAKHYNENLDGPKAEKARRYIEKREIPKSIVTRFGLGYSVDGEEMIAFLKGKGYSEEEMKEAGLAEKKVNEKGVRYYDVYYGRLMFPIINGFGDVIGFGGRVLEKTEMAKYRNTSSTPVFDKSRTIYAVNLLKKRKRQGKIDYVIMCEGYMDVIALHKAGFDTAVASMGTALTVQQARQIKNYSENVIISYDGDSAGQKATLRGLDILDGCGLNVRVAALPEGLDPDEVIKAEGKEGYKKCLENAMSLTSFKLKNIKAGYDLSDPDGRAKYAKEAVDCIAALKDPVKIEEYLKVVSKETGYSMNVLRQQAKLFVPPEKEETPVENLDELSDDVKFLLLSFVRGREYVNVEDIEKYMKGDFAEKVFSSVADSRLKGIKDCSSMLYSDLPESEHQKISALLSSEPKFSDNEDGYARVLRKLEFEGINNELKRLSAEYASPDTTPEKKKEDILIMNELNKRLRILKKADVAGDGSDT